MVSSWPEVTLVGLGKKKGLKHAVLSVSGGAAGGASPVLKAAVNPAYPDGTAAIGEVNENAEHDFQELPPQVQSSIEEKEKAAEDFVVAGVTLTVRRSPFRR